MKPYKFFIFAYWHDPRWKKFVGATVKIKDLAQNLSVLGHDVTLFLPRYHFGIENSSIKIVEIPFINLPLLRFLSFNLALTFFLLMTVFKTRPDVVYMRRMGSILPGIYARLVNSLFFYEINDDPYRRIYQEGSLMSFRIRKFISEFQDKINLKLCQRAFVITKEILEKILIENPELQAKKFVELPSGANTDLFRPLPVRECRARLNIDLEEKHVGFAGTLLRHQGIDVLVDAAPLILDREPSTRFVIIGEGPMKETWMNAVESKGLNMRFLFPGQIDYEDMPTWISAMDICVSPFVQSAGLRSPVKIFDYMACGKPVIASKIEGTTDIFNQSEAIKFVEPGDTEALSDAIIDLLANQKKAAQLGENGRRFIVAKYDRKVLANRIYKEAFSCKH